MRKVVIYKTGEAYYQGDDISISLHGGVIAEVIDLTDATEDEIKHLRLDPKNKVLIDKIKNRKKDKGVLG